MKPTDCPSPWRLAVETALTRLRSLTQKEVQHQWRYALGDDSSAQEPDPSHWPHWPLVTLNARHHVAWAAGRQVLWLGQVLQLPEALDGYPLTGWGVRLALTWWAEQADIFVNGQCVQQGDLYDCAARVMLSEALVPGETVEVAIRLVSPGHDPGALVRSRLLCEPPNDTDWVDPGLVADELAVLSGFVEALRPEAGEAIAQPVQALDWAARYQADRFTTALQQLRQGLAPWGQWLQDHTVYWVGHAHLDLAWLWPIPETWDVAERTFQSVLGLQADYPELIFCHSSPMLYDWLEQHRPALFQAIQQQVAAGRWEVAAGLWVEPEFNLVNGESIVRQVLYGQRYTQSRFGAVSRLAWLPDSFGFCWQLPQIFKQGGIDFFLTQKLRWNDTTTFPYGVFQWEAPDGTQIHSIMLPPIGEAMDPIRIGDHACSWEVQAGLRQSLWLPGVGDHGGGPTRDMLSVGRRWQTSQLFPTLKASSAQQFCQQVAALDHDWPVWRNELYLELHRGCYTAHADQKLYNRRCEQLLMEAELWSAIATLCLKAPYPKTDLEQVWKQVLFNQFHDILPGSSIPEVFAEANQNWEAALQTATALRHAAQQAIALAVDVSPFPGETAIPVIVFNGLNWSRSAVVCWPLPESLAETGTLTTATGRTLATQYDAAQHQLLFYLEDVPSIGYQQLWYQPEVSPPNLGDRPPQPTDWILENQHLRVSLCPQTGQIRSVWDKDQQREVLAGLGNQLQFFQDQGQYWDAWNIDPQYADHALEAATLASLHWIATGPVQQRLRVVLHWRNSTFIQDYVLETHSPLLHIESQVDWQETSVLVKTAFPLQLTAAQATYEIPCGAIERPTLPNPHPLPDWQRAKWEVPALHWADLTADAESTGTPYGVSLLNDCKYGYDAQPSQLRLTLLRSPKWPDPTCDRGIHRFTYALYPHAGAWTTAQTVRRGYALNRPLVAVVAAPSGRSLPKSLPPETSFWATSATNLVLMAFKQSEDHQQRWILRWHECHGDSAKADWQTHLPLQELGAVDGLEQQIEASLAITQPWQIQASLWHSSEL